MFSSYLSGSFQAGIWETNKRGLLTNKNNPEQMGSQWSSDTRVAVVLLREKKYIQSRRILSQICTAMELDIKFKPPSLIEDLLWATTALHMDGMDEIVSIIFRHGYSTAKQRLGSFHPVTKYAERC
jgi:hypothetical protein